MRKRFCVGMVIVLFATFSILTLATLGQKKKGNEHENCEGPSICAGARVYGKSKLFAWARASSPTSVKGRWGYKVKAGKNQEGPKRSTYQKGFSRSWEVDDYTSNASAYAENTGKAKDGKIYFATKSASSGG